MFKFSIIWKSDLTDKMKRSFFQAAVVSILLYGCTTWTLTGRLERKLDGNYTRMLRAVLNKSWRQHHTRLQLYGHLPPITKTIQVRRTRHAGHFWRSKDELISDVLLWTPTYGCAKVGRPARTYIQQLCEDTGCNPEDLPEAMNDREKWRDRVSDIRAGGARWWWWYIEMNRSWKWIWMWYFWLLIRKSVLHTCFRLRGLLQETNNVFNLMRMWFFLVQIYSFIYFIVRPNKCILCMFLCVYIRYHECKSGCFIFLFELNVCENV